MYVCVCGDGGGGVIPIPQFSSIFNSNVWLFQ